MISFAKLRKGAADHIVLQQKFVILVYLICFLVFFSFLLLRMTFSSLNLPDYMLIMFIFIPNFLFSSLEDGNLNFVTSSNKMNKNTDKLIVSNWHSLRGITWS